MRSSILRFPDWRTDARQSGSRSPAETAATRVRAAATACVRACADPQDRRWSTAGRTSELSQHNKIGQLAQALCPGAEPVERGQRVLAQFGSQLLRFGNAEHA